VHFGTVGGKTVYNRIIILLIIVCVVFTGCSGFGSGKKYERACDKLLNLKSYTCDVEMSVTNNKSTMNYRLRHSYISPDKYRIEVLEPKSLEGQVTIHNSRGTYIYHPSINEYLICEGFSDSPEGVSFAGSFINYIKSRENLKADRQQLGDQECYVLEFEVPKPNDYMNTQRIWIDVEAAVPVKTEIYDKSGKVTVDVRYSNFIHNPRLNEGDFIIPGIGYNF